MSIYQKVVELEESNHAGALCTIIEATGSAPRHEASKMIVYSNGKIAGTVGGGEIENRVIKEALKSIEDGKTRHLTYNLVDPQRGDVGVCGGTVEVYVEPILPKPVALVIGGGHVGKTVVHLAKWLGFHTIVSDDRAEFCTPEMVPEADEYIICSMAEIPAKTKIDRFTYIILTTRGSDVDVEGLPALLQTDARYLGIIGSKRRWLLTHKNLEGVGISEEQLSRVRSPIGLELKAETPEEIAVSIMAEVLMVQNGGTGEVMDYK